MATHTFMCSLGKPNHLISLVTQFSFRQRLVRTGQGKHATDPYRICTSLCPAVPQAMRPSVLPEFRGVLEDVIAPYEGAERNGSMSNYGICRKVIVRDVTRLPCRRIVGEYDGLRVRQVHVESQDMGTVLEPDLPGFGFNRLEQVFLRRRGAEAGQSVVLPQPHASAHSGSPSPWPNRATPNFVIAKSFEQSNDGNAYMFFFSFFVEIPTRSLVGGSPDDKQAPLHILTVGTWLRPCGCPVATKPLIMPLATPQLRVSFLTLTYR